MAYQPPAREHVFLLRDVLEIDRYSNLPAFADASMDVVEQIIGHRPAKCRRGRPQMEWLVRWQGMGPVEDQWRNYDDINTGGECEPWTDYERARLAESLVRGEANSVQVREWSDPKRPLRVLVLFSGTGSVENALHSLFPNVTSVSVDNVMAFTPAHCCTVQ